MPELAEWLHCLEVIEEIDDPAGRNLNSANSAQPCCPKCNTPVEIQQVTSRGVVVCSSCGATLDASSGDVAISCLGAERFAVQTRCPHCHHAIELVDDAEMSDVACPSCGSSFSLLGDEYVDDQGDRTVAHFRLVDRIGTGAFGSVWRACDTTLDRTVAIKIPRKGLLDPTEAEQFLREARSAAQLKHANIVTVHEVGRDEGQIYIVSDYIEGRTLADLLAEEQVTSREAVELCVTLAEALQHAHEAGVIHRDVKPSNIIVGRDGEPVW